MVLLTLPMQCLLCGSFLTIYILCFHCSLTVTRWEGQTSWLACMWSSLVFLSVSHVVSWVRCGAWLYWFLISASHLLSYIMGVCVYFLIVGSLARVQTYVQANAKVSYNIHKKGVYRPIPGHSLNWQGVFSMHFRVFSWSPGTEWVVFFWGLLKFQIFLGVLEIPDIFWSER